MFEHCHVLKYLELLFTDGSQSIDCFMLNSIRIEINKFFRMRSFQMNVSTCSRDKWKEEDNCWNKLLSYIIFLNLFTWKWIVLVRSIWCKRMNSFKRRSIISRADKNVKGQDDDCSIKSVVYRSILFRNRIRYFSICFSIKLCCSLICVILRASF